MRCCKEKLFILPESVIQGQQQFEDLRDIPEGDIEEDVPIERQRNQPRKDHHMAFWMDHNRCRQSSKKTKKAKHQQQEVGPDHLLQ